MRSCHTLISSCTSVWHAKPVSTDTSVHMTSSLQVSSDTQAPSGCAVNVVDDTTSVCLMLKGVLDPMKEAAKLTDKQVWHTSVHQLAAGF